MYVLDLEDIISRIRPYFGQTIIKRGWSYYLDQMVSNFIKKEIGYEAVVEGTSPYRVKINLFEFSSSSCTCPFDDYCKHMAAVLFHAIENEGLPAVELLHPNKIRKGNQISTLQRSTRAKKPEVMDLRETDSVETWHQFFSAKVEMRTNSTPYSFDAIFRLLKRDLDELCSSWELTKQWIYKLHVWLFLANWIESIYRKTENTYSYYDSLSFHRKQATEWLYDFIDIVSNVDEDVAFNQYKTYLSDTINYLAKHAFHEEHTITDWTFVYSYLWNALLFYKNWVDMEMQWLQLEITQSQSSAIRQDALKLALLHFEIMFGNDQKAMEIADTLQKKDVTWCIPHLRSFENHEAWSRLVLWLKWMKPLIKDVDRDVLRTYLNFWHTVGQNNHVDESEWENTLLYLLPRSDFEYAHFLLSRGKYQQWVDLHLFYEVSPTNIRSGDLKEIETHDRRSLLPLYHQAVERYILEKNRDSYKMAVKLLKKLRTHYKKLKDESRWERYIEYLSTQNKRLRALQEELQKGKLIP